MTDAKAPSAYTSEHDGNAEKNLAVSAALRSGKFASDRGQFKQALEHFERAWAELDKMAEPDPDLYHTCLSDLLDVYIFLDRQQDALVVATSLRKRYGVHRRDKESISLMLRTAFLYQRMDNLGEAEIIYLEAIELASEVLPAEDPIHARLNKGFIETHKKRQKDSSLTDSDKRSLLDSSKSGKDTQEPLSRRKIRPTTKERKLDSGNLLFSRLLGFVLDRIQQLLANPALQSPLVLAALGVALLWCTAATIFGLHFERTSRGSADAQIALGELHGNDFIAVDHGKSLFFLSKSACRIEHDNSAQSAPFEVLCGDPDDYGKILAGSMHATEEHWFTKCNGGFIDQDGTVLYAKNAPEFRVVQEMQDCAEFASKYYLQNRLYPADELKGSVSATEIYTNPVTGKAESAPIMYKKFASTGKGWGDRTARGQIWDGEGPFSAGQVHAACLDYCRFFVRGFDRKGRPLTSSKPFQYYFIELKNGVNVTAASSRDTKPAEDSSGKPLRIFISTGRDLSSEIFFVRSIIPGASWIVLLLALLVMAFAPPRAGTLVKPLCIIVMTSAVLVLGVWYYWATHA